MINLKKFLKNEEGNALFLILIAVTLFAALSYAVTQSGRGSSGGATDDANLISSSQITQYPAAIRSGVDRLLIRGWGASQLFFITNVADADYDEPQNLFNPNGLAGVIAQDPPQSAVVNSSTAAWVYNKTAALPGVGDDAVEDIVAILPGVLERVCTMLNDQIVGRDYFSTANNIPVLGGAIAALDTDTTAITSAQWAAADAGDTTLMQGKAFLCVQNGAAGEFVYYHALAEL